MIPGKDCSLEETITNMSGLIESLGIKIEIAATHRLGRYARMQFVCPIPPRTTRFHMGPSRARLKSEASRASGYPNTPTFPFQI
jgi:hypothetical protein